MKIVKRKDAKIIQSPCGKIEETHSSDKLSISFATITNKYPKHMHKEILEVYVILKGAGKITLNNKTFEVNSGDTITIEPNTYHSLEPNGSVEMLVVTYPKYNPEDVHELKK